MPSFGQTECPSRESQLYTFDYLARVMDAFTEAIGLKHFAMYIFDYGAPVGMRLALWHPERAEMQNYLILDYQSNVRLYPEFQKYFREHHPRLLAVWGKTTLPSFLPEPKPSSATYQAPW